jgi:hypothetical protein
MKIRSLLLGSVAAAGLSTGAYAADLGVLTSLDVCDALGLSGLTISSDTNCLQITGSVSYEFQWGDYEGDSTASVLVAPYTQYSSAPANDGLVVTGAGAHTLKTPGFEAGFPDRNLDWYSKVEAWIKFVATADSDFGPAKAVIKIKDLQEWKTVNERYIAGKVSPFAPTVDLYGPAGVPDGVADGVAGTGGDHTFGPIFDEAYVSVGDSTVLMAGKKGTIMNFGDDVPLNFLGLFNSEKVDTGVKWNVSLPDGGHVIQVVSDLGNGVSVGAGLEKLELTGATAGTAVGVLSYAGDGIAAHVTLVAGGVLDGIVENWGIHAGVSGTFDIVKFVGAFAADNSGYWNALGSASATFDMFTIAVSGEAVQNNATSGGGNGGLDYGVGGSVSAAVTDGVTVNLGGRWYQDTGAADTGWQVAAQLVAAVTETITLTGEVGAYGDIEPAAFNGPYDPVYYGAAQVAWAPGGGFTSSVKGEVFSNGAYRATFKAAKTFE